MLNHEKTLLVIIVWAAMCLAPLPPSGKGGGQDTSADKVVALVEDRPITESEISMPEESLRLKYRLIHGKYPETLSELNQLAELSRKTRMELLAGRIRAILREEQIKKFEIQVTDEELQTRHAELLRGVNLDLEIAKQREKLVPLIKALRSVMRAQMDEKMAYDVYLSQSFTYEEWLVHRQYYHNEKRVALLERLSKATVDDLRKPDAGTRALIIEEKLNRKIDQEIVRIDPEFADYNRARQSNDRETIRKFEEKNPLYLKERRKDWWREQSTRAKIRILDSKYSDVLNHIF